MFGTDSAAARGEHMPWDIFKSLLPLFPYLRLAVLSGYGEPLLHPRYREMIDLLSQHKVEIQFNTNGLLLTDAMARFLIERQVYLVEISFDAATKETYESIRIGSEFKRVVENIRTITELKKRFHSQRPKLVFHYVMMRRNIEELPELVRLAKAVGVEEVWARYLVVGKEDLRKESLYYHQDLANRCILKARDVARELGIILSDSGLFGITPTRVASEKCPDPWGKIYVQYDGIIYPCCQSKVSMGSIKSHAFTEIWNNNHYQGLRYALVTKKPPTYCLYCLDSLAGAAGINTLGGHILSERKPVKEDATRTSVASTIKIADEGQLNNEYVKAVDYIKDLEVYVLSHKAAPAQCCIPAEQLSARQLFKILLSKILPMSCYIRLVKLYHLFKK